MIFSNGNTLRSNHASVLVWIACWLSLFASANLSAQLIQERLDSSNRVNNEGQTRREPIQITGNIWWVGHSEVGSFLITTSEGLILMDTTSTEHAPWVIDNIAKAGFKIEDIKYIINSHPHEEHIGGLAQFRKLVPDAKIVTSTGTAAIIASGGRSDFRNILEGDAGADYFEPVQVDATIGHLEELKLGDVTLVAHITSGHTAGATTWTMKVRDAGKEYNAVFMGGMSASGMDRGPLLRNELYPEIADDFEKSFDHLNTLQCDFYLYARASSIELDKKLEKLRQGGNVQNPFIDPEGCAHYINFYDARYRKQLEEERATKI